MTKIDIPEIRIKKKDRPELEPQEMVEQLLHPKVTIRQKIVHGLNIAWQYCKGKKRLASNVLTIAGAVFLKAGDIITGSALLAGASILGGVAIVEKSAEKLNQKTSGTKINWAEVVTLLIELLRSLFDKRKQTSEGKEK